MKINGVDVELAINEAEISGLLENYSLDLDPTIPPENIARYVEEQKNSLLVKHQHLIKQINTLYEVKLSELVKDQEKAQTQV
jgi:hypothetical protein